MWKLITACPAASGRRTRRGNHRKACPWQVWEGAGDLCWEPDIGGHDCSSVCWAVYATTGVLLEIWCLCGPPYCWLHQATIEKVYPDVYLQKNSNNRKKKNYFLWLLLKWIILLSMDELINICICLFPQCIWWIITETKTVKLNLVPCIPGSRCFASELQCWYL